MSDLVERLRAWHTPNETITGDVQLYLDAADRIEALEAALREIANFPFMNEDLCVEEIARAALVPPGMHKFTDANGPDE